MPTLLLMFTPWLKTPANYNDIVIIPQTFGVVQHLSYKTCSSGDSHEVISSGEKKYYEILISLPFWFI